jgi:zinc-ribbon domain
VAFCPGCGVELPPNARFCVQCGTPMTTSAGIPPQPPTQGPPVAKQAPKNKNPVAPGCTGCLGVIVFFVIVAAVVGTCSGPSTSSSSDSKSDTSAVSDTAPQPTQESVQQQKKDFLASVDESISGAMIAGNKLKYVGDTVDLHCNVLAIVDESHFNATCGTDEDDLPAIILVEYDDTSSLDKGQAVRIMGTVEEPTEGVNGFGGESTFPTVKAEFME